MLIKLFQQWTGIGLTEKTLANQVEAKGLQLQLAEESCIGWQCKPPDKEEDVPKMETHKEKIYVGVDGVMTPLNQKQGHKEAKVGVNFLVKRPSKNQG